MHKQCGFNGKIIHTVDPLNLQTVPSLKFKDCESGNERKRSLAPVIGHGLFTIDEKEWEWSRAALRPFLGKRGGPEGVERHVEDLLKALKSKTGEGGWTREVDMMELFPRFTMDSTTEFLFGESMGSQLSEHEREGTSLQRFPSQLHELAFASTSPRRPGHPLSSPSRPKAASSTRHSRPSCGSWCRMLRGRCRRSGRRSGRARRDVPRTRAARTMRSPMGASFSSTLWRRTS
jgi:hypothetical protein